MKKQIYILLIFCFPMLLLAQKKETLVYLEHSNTLSFDEERYENAQLLRGNVRFRHEDVLMFCDSALFYEDSNSLDAFGHVHFVQGDTVEGFGDVLYYDGNTKLARLRRQVRWIHKGTTLTTDSLNYDRANNIAWYYTGGMVQDSLNTLTSLWGQYTTNDKQALFKTDVVLTNEQFVLKTDTLCYNTESNIAQIVSPTEIVYEEETTITSSDGWYNTRTEESMLLNRSLIHHNDGKSLTGDTIFYDKSLGHGEAFGRIEMADSAKNITIYGNYGEVFEDQKRGYATDSALLIDRSDDDWFYLHADTLFSEEIAYKTFSLQERDSIMKDSLMVAQAPDTIFIDTTYIEIRAYRNTRAFRVDMQMVCDSMVYNGRDSIIMLYTDPVCWSDEQQISADSIYIYLKNQAVDYAHGFGNAIAVQQDSPTQFNQLAGKELKAYIIDGELKRMNVDGNAQTVFYPREDDGSLVGVNKTQSSYVTIYFEDKTIDHILFTTTSSGVLYPIDDISESETRLGSFFWAEQERPLVPGDVFLKPEKAVRPSSAPLSAKEETPQKEKGKKKDRSDKENKGNTKRRL